MSIKVATIIDVLQRKCKTEALQSIIKPYEVVGTMELKNKIRKIRYRSYKGAILPISPNIINRNFIAQTLNRKWATDVTQINIGSEKLYLSLILDMFNGKIIFLTYPEVPFLSKYTICLTRRLLSSTILTD